MRYSGQRHLSLLILCGALFLLGACSQPVSNEAKLRQAVAKMEKAAEARQSGPILDYLSSQFIGNGTYRKANIQSMLRLFFSQNPHVRVFLHISRIQLRHGSAQLTCKVLLTGWNKSVLPEHARALVVDTHWQKRDGEWRVVRARWQDPLIQP